MTAHAETHAPEASHDIHVDAADPRLQLAASLKFEPSELHDFELADRAAGQMMGKLLAFLFCVLLTLMTGVNLWMIKNAAKTTDPQAPVVVEEHAATGGHH